MKIAQLAASAIMVCVGSPSHSTAQTVDPLRVAVAGLTHTHVHWILGRDDRGDIKLVGISETNRDLANRYIRQHKLDPGLLHHNLIEMIEAVQPEAVCAFGAIREHLEIVRTCAPRGIHVMVEKPLAVSLEHAEEMAALAKKHDILLLTNYETTWYPTTRDALRRVREQNEIGELRKMVFHDGHPGPVEIGVNKEFLDWLIDPYHSGAGALTDFGCYGANLATAFMGNVAPKSVWATTQQLKPHLYPDVDDDATIVLGYERGQVIVQASWNWPVSRKDMELYGENGQIIAPDGQHLRLWDRDGKEPRQIKSPAVPAPLNDPFAYFAAAVRGDIDARDGLSSLENNLIVMRILQAALDSAKSGRTVTLK